MSSYTEKLKDPRWQKMRLKVMEYAKFRCQICGAKERTLHVHHSYYAKGKEPWEYPAGSLICVCEVCHEKLHPERKEQSNKDQINQPMSDEDIAAQFSRLRKQLAAKLK